MPGVFDDENLGPDHEPRDKEFTLGPGLLLALFFGLVLLCSFCFAVGYSVGHHGQKSATAAAPTAPGEQEPLQANGAIPKPSAIAQDVVAHPQPAAEPEASPAESSGPPPVEAAQVAVPVTPVPASSAQGTAFPAQQPQVHSALTAGVNTAASQQAPMVRPALAPPANIMVQIAAVANPEDADVLVGALRKRSYSVTARRDPTDNLIHVRIGPFATRAEADQWRMRLLNDGYNAIMQP